MGLREAFNYTNFRVGVRWVPTCLYVVPPGAPEADKRAMYAATLPLKNPFGCTGFPYNQTVPKPSYRVLENYQHYSTGFIGRGVL